MKKIILVLILLINFSSIFSQEEFLENQFKLEYNFLGVGVSYDLPISKTMLIDFGIGLGGGVDSEDGYVWHLNSNLAAYFKGELKRYYNLKKRFKKGENMANNSGNYMALQTKYFTRRFSPDEDFLPLQNALLTELHWGLQRSLGGNWLFNLHLGFGVLRNLDTKNGLLSPAMGLKFSYKLL